MNLKCKLDSTKQYLPVDRHLELLSDIIFGLDFTLLRLSVKHDHDEALSHWLNM
jgi:hypothetical protein